MFCLILTCSDTAGAALASPPSQKHSQVVTISANVLSKGVEGGVVLTWPNQYNRCCAVRWEAGGCLVRSRSMMLETRYCHFIPAIVHSAIVSKPSILSASVLMRGQVSAPQRRMERERRCCRCVIWSLMRWNGASTMVSREFAWHWLKEHVSNLSQLLPWLVTVDPRELKEVVLNFPSLPPTTDV